MKYFSQLIFYMLLLIFVAGIIFSFGNENNAPTGITQEYFETALDILESTENFTTIATTAPTAASEPIFSSLDILPYEGAAYIEINQNQPFFTTAELITTPFEKYSDLDSLGRCGMAYANICKELMPTEKRESIGQIKPSGWHTVKYPDLIPDLYLYNRCHLIAHQLAGENANPLNLITGTRYMNAEIMTIFEHQVADYVTATNNHCLYRVTPVFEGNNLVATGVLIEAKSVEDNGSGICFNVFLYNIQPGITIDYATGDSFVTPKETETATEIIEIFETETFLEPSEERELLPVSNETTYVLNTNSKKFHYPYCSSVDDMAPHNRQDVIWSREEIIAAHYQPCKRCNP